MGPNENLPPLPVWQSRAFWLTMLAAAIAVGELFGFNVLTALGVTTQEAAADKIMYVVQAVAVLLALGQRAAPNYRLTLGSSSDGKVRSPWIVGLAALGLVFTLSACQTLAALQAKVEEHTGLTATQQTCIADAFAQLQQDPAAADLSFRARAGLIADFCEVDFNAVANHLLSEEA